MKAGQKTGGFRRAVPFLTLGVLIFAGGCASSNKGSQVNMTVDPGIVKLSEAANEISEHHRVLSFAESARHSQTGAAEPSKRYKPEDFPPEWRAQYVLQEDFYGELEPFLRGLSRLVGYDEPQIVGSRPVLPIIVSMNRDRRSLGDFLVDASHQTGGRATVSLHEGNNRLQIRYK